MLGTHQVLHRGNLSGHLGDHTRQGGQPVNPVRGEGFQIRLDAGPGRVVGTGDGQAPRAERRSRLHRGQQTRKLTKRNFSGRSVIAPTRRGELSRCMMTLIQQQGIPFFDGQAGSPTKVAGHSPPWQKPSFNLPPPCDAPPDRPFPFVCTRWYDLQQIGSVRAVTIKARKWIIKDLVANGTLPRGGRRRGRAGRCPQGWSRGKIFRLPKLPRRSLPTASAEGAFPRVR